MAAKVDARLMTGGVPVTPVVEVEAGTFGWRPLPRSWASSQAGPCHRLLARSRWRCRNRRQPPDAVLLPASEPQSPSRSSVSFRSGGVRCGKGCRHPAPAHDLRLPAGCSVISDAARSGCRSRGAGLSGAGPGELGRVGRPAVGGAQGARRSPGAVVVPAGTMPRSTEWWIRLQVATQQGIFAQTPAYA